MLSANITYENITKTKKGNTIVLLANLPINIMLHNFISWKINNMKFEYYGRDWKIIPQNLSKSQLGMGMEVDDGRGGFNGVVAQLGMGMEVDDGRSAFSGVVGGG